MTPWRTILVRHKVEDYAKWKPVFDEQGATRQSSESKGATLLRNADDPDELVVLMKWDDIARAKEFANSDDLKQVMGRAGVADHPGHILPRQGGDSAALRP